MKKIKVVISVLTILLMSTLLHAKENSFKTIPEKPKAGDEINVVYSQIGTPLEKASSIQLIVYIFSINSEHAYKYDTVYTVAMNKAADLWKTSIKTKNSTDFIALEFAEGDTRDNNNDQGYYIKIYDSNGDETINSKLIYAAAIGYFGRYTMKIKYDPKWAYSKMSEIFYSAPQAKLNILPIYYYIMIDALSPEDAKLKAEDEQSSIPKINELNDNQLSGLLNLYKKFKMQQKADEIIAFAVEKFPFGKIAFDKKYNDLLIEKDLKKRLDLAEQLVTKFDGRDIGYYKVFENLFLEKKYEIINDLLEKNPLLADYKSVRNLIVNNFIKANINLEMALKLAEKSVAGARENISNPKPMAHFNPGMSFIVQSRNYDLFYSLYSYGDVLMLFNKSEEALKQYDEARELMPQNELNAGQVESYTECLVKNKKYESAKKFIEESINKNINSDKLRKLLQEAYTAVNNSEAGFDDYLNSLEKVVKQKNLEKIKSEILNEPAPAFTLKDLDGKKVTLSDLKGKVLVLDFWATWCGPCKASFPGMKLAVNKYQNDKDVMFLFIDTWESVENKEAVVRDFITKNNYPFHVLLDNDNQVIKSYRVEGIPTKFILDKNGKIKFKVVGSSDNPEAIVDEVSAMIDLVLKQI